MSEADQVKWDRHLLLLQFERVYTNNRTNYKPIFGWIGGFCNTRAVEHFL